MSDFEYVLCKEKPAKICFLSTIEREVFPNKQQLLAKNLGPTTYYYTQPTFKKVCLDSNFASKTPRFKIGKIEVRPNFYDYYVPPIKKSKQFFGRLNNYPKSNQCTPGVGIYNISSNNILNNNQCHSFGGKIKIIPAVKIICNPSNLDKCIKCNKTSGDYWKHSIKNKNLCRSCMSEEIKITKNNVQKTADLKRFKRVRYCGFYHDHKNTTARLTLLPKLEVLKKIRIENYLAKFNM